MDNCWSDMYRRDKYARDRVLKSACLVRELLKPHDVVVDIGCFTQEAKKYFPKSVKYIGLDREAYHKENVIVNLDSDFQIPECKVVLCLETLEHLTNPLRTLQAIHNILLPSGLVVVSLPNEATLFHRLRSLLGTVDADCFSYPGKHLHLPNLRQSRNFLYKGGFQIQKEKYYIAPSGCNSKQQWVGWLLSKIPDKIHQGLADWWPSLFARGFIFLLTPDNNSHQLPTQSPLS